MRLFTKAAAIAVLAVTAACANANGTPDVTRTNVAAAAGSGSVGPAFYVDGYGYFVAEATAPYAVDTATVVPASYDVWNPNDVADYLKSIGIERFNIVLKSAEKTCRLSTTDPDGGFCNVDDGLPITFGEDKTGYDRLVNGGW